MDLSLLFLALAALPPQEEAVPSAGANSEVVLRAFDDPTPRWLFALPTVRGSVLVGWRQVYDGSDHRYEVERRQQSGDEWTVLGQTATVGFEDDPGPGRWDYRISCLEGGSFSEPISVQVGPPIRRSPMRWVPDPHTGSLEQVQGESSPVPHPNLVRKYPGFFAGEAMWLGSEVYVGFMDDDDDLDYVGVRPHEVRPLEDSRGWFADSKKRVFSGKSGELLWESEAYQPTGMHAQHVCCWNIDDDPAWELITIEGVGRLVIRDGKTGALEKSFEDHPVLQQVRNRDRSNIEVCNLRGLPRARDIIVNRGTYLHKPAGRDHEDLGRRYRLKYAVNPPIEKAFDPRINSEMCFRDIGGERWFLWECPQYLAFTDGLELLWWLWVQDESPHNPECADLDGDGKDEVIVSGNMAFRPDGSGHLWQIPDLSERYGDLGPGSRMWGQLDGLMIGDWRPELAGPEIYMAGEENDTSLAMLSASGEVLWYDSKTYGTELNNDHAVYTHFAAGDIIPSIPGAELVVQRPDPGNENETGGVYSADGRRLWGIVPPDGRWFDLGKGNHEGAPRVLNWLGDQSAGEEIAINLWNRELERFEVKVYSFADPADPTLLLVVPGFLQQVVDVIGDGREEVLVTDRNALFVYTNPEVPETPTPTVWMDQYQARRRYISPFSKF